MLKKLINKLFGRIEPSVPVPPVMDILSATRKFEKEEKPKEISLSREEILERLKPTVLKTVKIEATIAHGLSLTTSRFLGDPYLPTGNTYPLDEKQRPMPLLVQINFAEMPLLEGYPTEGLLQIFLSASTDIDDMYGLNFENPLPQINHRILFHEKIDEKCTQIDIPEIDRWHGDFDFPITKSHRLDFKLVEEFVPESDFRHQALWGSGYPSEYDDDFCKNYNELADSSGHKIGGYAYFTQNDPRSYKNSPYKDHILLLQIDSVNDDICWGDVGVANWFIRAEDLKNKDFSEVMYHWDCC